MKDEIGYLVEKRFRFLETDHGFKITYRESLDSNCQIEFSSPDVVVKVEKYRRELYCYVSKFGDPDSEAHLFNLIRYLHRAGPKEKPLHYFANVKDVSESLGLQIELIGEQLEENYFAIKAFFFSLTLTYLNKIQIYLGRERHPSARGCRLTLRKGSAQKYLLLNSRILNSLIIKKPCAADLLLGPGLYLYREALSLASVRFHAFSKPSCYDLSDDKMSTLHRPLHQGACRKMEHKGSSVKRAASTNRLPTS
jgi:hypothetical protein